MKAGRQLDSLIAEKVFDRDPLLARQGLHANGDLEYSWGYPLGHDTAPAYSTDMNATLLVIDKLREKGLLVEIQAMIGGYFEIAIWNRTLITEIAKIKHSDLAPSICNLALEVLDIKEPAA